MLDGQGLRKVYGQQGRSADHLSRTQGGRTISVRGEVCNRVNIYIFAHCG